MSRDTIKSIVFYSHFKFDYECKISSSKYFVCNGRVLLKKINLFKKNDRRPQQKGKTHCISIFMSPALGSLCIVI